MNKKKIIFSCCICVLQIVLFAQKKDYKIYETTNGWYNGNVYLFFEGNFKKRDSIHCPVKDGKFYFEGKVMMPILARLHLDGTSLISDFYLENTTTYIACDLASKITGQDTLNMVNVISVKNSKSFLTQKKLMDTLNNTTASTKESEIVVYKILHDFISKYPGSKVGAYCLNNYSSLLTYDEIKRLRQLFSPSLKDSYEMKLIDNTLASAGKVDLRSPGLAFHDIISKDTSDNSVDTKNFRGKYLLVVCWATWCKPCRNEHPQLNNMYKKYSDKNFEMLGVSLDESGSEQKWKQAIIKDKLTWPQVSDMKGFDSEISKYYKLQGEGIPFNFLIDKTGKIIGSKLQLNEVESILQKELN